MHHVLTASGSLLALTLSAPLARRLADEAHPGMPDRLDQWAQRHATDMTRLLTAWGKDVEQGLNDAGTAAHGAMRALALMLLGVPPEQALDPVAAHVLVGVLEHDVLAQSAVPAWWGTARAMADGLLGGSTAAKRPKP